MNRISIGIHLHAEPERLHATLASLRAHTSHDIDLLLLPDGPDQGTRAALEALPEVPQAGTLEPFGPPACFNRLAASSEADVLVLLESGALVGPGWFDYLLAALQADPHHGIAGPSTNRSWNEQGIFSRCGNTFADIARTAQEAAQRFGTAWRTLEPLHSLADFCYVVRREVVQTIGAADEGYGQGPCWEMDYNIRAARAGFRGVWACAAYVHRSPFTMRRRREEAQRFETSKQRYQDKFCALRLRGERSTYVSHCHGEDCEHFAPSSLIQLQKPLPRVPFPAPSEGSESSPQTLNVSAGLSVHAQTPLVSCIMPTRQRTAFALQAIRYFQRQDYPTCELIIIDDSPEELAGYLPDDPRIRYLRLPSIRSIGAKRNHACELARGDIIAHWDDDDWYAPDRLSRQIAPLLSGVADISGLRETVFFDLDRWEFWGCTPQLHRRLFVDDVHGGTLVYRRHVWQDGARYPDQSLAEDAAFLRQALRRGTRLSRLPNDGRFLYMRHGGNSWAFSCGLHVDPQGWQRVPEPPMPPEDRDFYATYTSATSHPASVEPLVSCIMPTADRRVLVARAIQYFLRQDYPNRELIVVDDGADAVADLIPSTELIRYIRLQNRRSIGAKRNLACQEAAGTIIVHWDDDDWIAPWRIRYQANRLGQEHADICGLDKVLHFDPQMGQSWQYIYPADEKPWVAGNTLCYTKTFWQCNPFQDIDVGEDTRFVWSRQTKRIITLQDNTFYVALIHPRNTSPKRLTSARWHAYPVAELQHLMGEDWSFYMQHFSVGRVPVT